MFIYTTGDLLQSDAQALVNTVNCEGIMGKGIAYQFKNRYPQNFQEYRLACKSGFLRPGRLVYCYEQGKIIINFPTKDKWRNPSEMQYISDGLNALLPLMDGLHVESIAIPPLGSGNGGLPWQPVRELIETKLSGVARSTQISIYGPSQTYHSRPLQEPKLSASALVLMEIKQGLDTQGKRLGRLRMQKTAYFMNLFLKKPYFQFKKEKYGPYCHAIEIISREIGEYQVYHNLKSTAEAEAILYQKIVSKSVESTLSRLRPAIGKACIFVNTIPTDHELECLTTVCFLIEQQYGMTEETIVTAFLDWSPDKARRFSKADIISAIDALYRAQIIEKNLDGFVIMPLFTVRNN